MLLIYLQQADLRFCWSHIPHCWKSQALAHTFTAILLRLFQEERHARLASHGNNRLLRDSRENVCLLK